MTTPRVQSFVLISMLRGLPKTPPSGDNLGVLNYHLNGNDYIEVGYVGKEVYDTPACSLI